MGATFHISSHPLGEKELPYNVIINSVIYWAYWVCANHKTLLKTPKNKDDDRQQYWCLWMPISDAIIVIYGAVFFKQSS